MCDFAVGLSRQLYGLTIASERANHRMMEQWHPLGPVGIITAFNFPVAVWAWNAAVAAVCGDVCVWKPAPQAPLTAIAVQRIINSVTTHHDVEGVFSLCIGEGASVGRMDRGRSAVPARLGDGQLPNGPQRRSDRGRSAGAVAVGTRRQQRGDHLREGRPRFGVKGRGLRRRRNRGAALHFASPVVSARVDCGRFSEPAHVCL